MGGDRDARWDGVDPRYYCRNSEKSHTTDRKIFDRKTKSFKFDGTTVATCKLSN